MARVGVITGLEREASVLEVFSYEIRPLVRVSGTRSGRAGEAARALLAEGCDGLLSFGVCGGLNRALRPGTVIIATKVLTNDGENFATNGTWCSALGTALSGRCPFINAPIYGSAHVITTTRAKRELFTKTGAAAVDMESHEVAAVAAERGVPFLAVRAVADSARSRVPSAALYGIREDGSTRVDALIAGLLIRPWQTPALIRLAWDSFSAQSALRRVATLTDPRFALR